MTANPALRRPQPVRRGHAPETSWPVSVGTLQRAWRAIKAGDYDNRQPSLVQTRHSDPLEGWTPEADEQVVNIVGAAGGVGATTVALAVATAGAPSRLLEGRPPERSGLHGACTAELGETDGWLHGRRGEVELFRGAVTVQPVVPARAADCRLTVVDRGCWLDDAGVWLHFADSADNPIVLVAPATVPGLRRAEACLIDLPPERVVVASVGRPVRRWPRQLAASAGPSCSRTLDLNRWVAVPTRPDLAMNGITPAELPRDVAAAGRQILTCLEGLN